MAKKFRHFLSSAGPAGRPSSWQLITKKRMEQHKTRSFLLRGKKKTARDHLCHIHTELCA